MCVADMLEEFTEIKKLGCKPELAHRLDRCYSFGVIDIHLFCQGSCFIFLVGS